MLCCGLHLGVDRPGQPMTIILKEYSVYLHHMEHEWKPIVKKKHFLNVKKNTTKTLFYFKMLHDIHMIFFIITDPGI